MLDQTDLGFDPAMPRHVVNSFPIFTDGTIEVEKLGLARSHIVSSWQRWNPGLPRLLDAGGTLDYLRPLLTCLPEVLVCPSSFGLERSLGGKYKEAIISVWYQF